MQQEKLVRRITADPGMLVGKPTISGLGISVEQILNALAGGVSVGDLHQDCHQCGGGWLRSAGQLPRMRLDSGEAARCAP